MDWTKNSKIADNVLESIGQTPMIRLNKLYPDIKPELCVKLEYTNPSGSLKDRVVKAIVEQAEAKGELKPGMIILEGTTGNTGIAAAMVGAAKGYQVIIVMPEGMSEERKKTIRAYGAELVLTPGAETDVDLVLEEVNRLKEHYGEQVFELGQFVRRENVMAHYENTAPEIWEQTEGQLEAFVMNQGTGGTVTGTAIFLKERNPDIKVFISEPVESPILACKKIGRHLVQGVADGLIPKILDLQYIDGAILVSSDDSIKAAQEIAEKEGIFCGISSGCNLAAARKLALKYPDMKLIVTMINDNGLRYLSTPLCGCERQCQKLDRKYELSREDKDKLAGYTLEVIE